jgi:hypothetical protein
MLQVHIEEAAKADEVFHMLVGEEVPPRKAFIQAHAKSIRNLDISLLALPGLPILQFCIYPPIQFGWLTGYRSKCTTSKAIKMIRATMNRNSAMRKVHEAIRRAPRIRAMTPKARNMIANARNIDVPLYSQATHEDRGRQQSCQARVFKGRLLTRSPSL